MRAPLILAAFAAFIWLHDTSWMSTAEDTLPILAALPLFIWMGSPWTFKTEKVDYQPTDFIIPTLLFLLGIVLNLNFLLALSWVFLFYAIYSKRLITPSQQSLTKLLVIALMAFPWISLDANQIGWYFRLSGAWTTAHLFSLFGNDVQQMGTNLLINRLPISVEAACAGLNTLQSMLIAGTGIAYLSLGTTSRFWWNLPLLVVMSWAANTLRIIMLSIVALNLGTSFAMSSFHTIGGWVVILLMFGLCYLIFSYQEPKKERS